MNESFKKLIVFISAALIVGICIYFFSGSSPDESTDSSNDSIAVKEFKLRCDSLRTKRWNQSDYKNLNGTLVAMKSNDVFTSSDASNLEIYLNQAYSNTLKDSCASWLTTNGNDADRKLLSEMEMLASYPECSKILTSEITIMRAYFSALQIPTKIRNFLQSKYSLEQYNRLTSEINSTARKAEIRHFSSMIRVASNGNNDLNEFQKYAINFDGAYAYYSNNKEDIDGVDIISRLCPNVNPKTKLYSFYLQQLNSLQGICK